MKKRLIVVLAVLATVVGMAFAVTTVHLYAGCNHWCTTGGTIVAEKDIDGKTYKKASVTYKGKCPACIKEEEHKKNCESAYGAGANKTILDAMQCNPTF